MLVHQTSHAARSGRLFFHPSSPGGVRDVRQTISQLRDHCLVESGIYSSTLSRRHPASQKNKNKNKTVSAVFQPCRTCYMQFVLHARCVLYVSRQINDDDYITLHKSYLEWPK